MKRDWNSRAQEDPHWYINCIQHHQSPQDFDASGLAEVDSLVRPDLRLLCDGRDPGGLSLLELGCGLGRMSRPLAGIFGQVCATDVSGEMIAQARGRSSGYASLRFLETNGVDLREVAGQSIDVAFSVYVFQHIPSAEVICSNLNEVYRVLRPGGTFKFQFNSVVAPEYLQTTKSTWAGDVLSAERLRALTVEWGARLIGLSGAGSQYAWAILRKPGGDERVARNASGIRIPAAGSEADLEQAPPAGGAGASLSLLLADSPAQVDINCLSLRIGGMSVPATYVYPFDPACRPLAGLSAVPQDESGWVHVVVPLPPGLVAGQTTVEVSCDGHWSPPRNCQLEAPRPVPPCIREVKNARDGGHDIDEAAVLQGLSLVVSELPEDVTLEQLQLRVGEQSFAPTLVQFLPGNALHRVDLPPPPNDTGKRSSGSECGGPESSAGSGGLSGGESWAGSASCP